MNSMKLPMMTMNWNRARFMIWNQTVTQTFSAIVIAIVRHGLHLYYPKFAHSPIPKSSAMMTIDRDRNRRRDVLKNISLLLTRLRGLNVLDVTQSNIVCDDEYHPERDRPRDYCILASLLHPITVMTRLHTLIWNDDILQYQPPDPHVYATGMSKLPATLTHLSTTHGGVMVFILS